LCTCCMLGARVFRSGQASYQSKPKVASTPSLAPSCRQGTSAHESHAHARDWPAPRICAAAEPLGATLACAGAAAAATGAGGNALGTEAGGTAPGSAAGHGSGGATSLVSGGARAPRDAHAPPADVMARATGIAIGMESSASARPWIGQRPLPRPQPLPP